MLVIFVFMIGYVLLFVFVFVFFFFFFKDWVGLDHGFGALDLAQKWLDKACRAHRA